MTLRTSLRLARIVDLINNIIFEKCDARFYCLRLESVVWRLYMRFSENPGNCKYSLYDLGSVPVSFPALQN